MALGADRDGAVVADADAGLLAPDQGPPRTGGDGAQHGAVFAQGQVTGGLWGGAEFPVDFVLVGVRQELVEQAVGPFEFEDLIGAQEGRETFLPVGVTAFDFAFGLRGRGVAQRDTVEVEGLTELGEGVEVVRVERGMVVHVEGQGQAMGLEGTRQKIEMGQEGFAGGEAGSGVVTGGFVQQVQQGLLIGISG